MPVWYRDEPDDNGDAVEIFRGTVWEMACALDAAQVEIERLTAFIRERVKCDLLRTKGGYHGRRVYLEAREILAGKPVRGHGITPKSQR